MYSGYWKLQLDKMLKDAPDKIGDALKCRFIKTLTEQFLPAVVSKKSQEADEGPMLSGSPMTIDGYAEAKRQVIRQQRLSLLSETPAATLTQNLRNLLGKYPTDLELLAIPFSVDERSLLSEMLAYFRKGMKLENGGQGNDLHDTYVLELQSQFLGLGEEDGIIGAEPMW